METTIIMHGNLKGLLRSGLADRDEIFHVLERRASVKDVIESLGVPHPEIGRLTVNGADVSFSRILEAGDRVEVWPLTPVFDVCTSSILRPNPLTVVRFVVDVNVGKLARLLRMAGFDVIFRNDLSDDELAEISCGQERILLTRDVWLLKRRKIEFGHLVRGIIPKEQLVEVVCLFGLTDMLRPFTRCLCCNGLLVPVAKEDILPRLEPLTRKYYNTFHICMGCDKIFWPGSHKDMMQEYIAAITETRQGKDYMN